MIRRRFLFLIGFLLLVTACAGHGHDSHEGERVIPFQVDDESKVTPEPLASAEVGWCLVRPDLDEDSLMLSRIDCDLPHTIEVYTIVDLQAEMSGAYPGVQASQSLFRDTCENAYRELYGVGSVEHGLGMAILALPSDAFWQESGGRIPCGIFPLSLQPETGDILKKYQTKK